VPPVPPVSPVPPVLPLSDELLVVGKDWLLAPHPAMTVMNSKVIRTEKNLLFDMFLMPSLDI
jgi:hypothetical protein